MKSNRVLKTITFRAFKGWIELYFHNNQYPRFGIHWRLKRYKGTFGFAIILFGRWFGILIDNPVFETNEEEV